MTDAALPALCIDDVAVTVSGLCIDRRDALVRADGSVLTVEVIGVETGVACVRATGGAMLNARVGDLTALDPQSRSQPQENA